MHITRDNISIVIPSLGRDSLRQCVASVNYTLPGCEIIVVGKPDIRQILFGFNYIYVEEPQNFGSISQVFNAGFVRARKDWVVALNDDMELIRFPVDFDLDADTIYAVGVSHDSNKTEAEEYVKEHIAEYPDCALLSRQLGNKLRWWDDKYKFYFADVDLACKAWLYAGGVKEFRGSLVFHQPLEDWEKAKVERFYEQDKKLFYETWQPHEEKLKRAMEDKRA